jgi:hypothetical protein
MQGCVGDAFTTLGHQVYAAGQSRGLQAWFDQKCSLKKLRLAAERAAR